MTLLKQSPDTNLGFFSELLGAFSRPSQCKSQLLRANPQMRDSGQAGENPRFRRNGRNIPSSELHLDGCAPGPGRHQTGLPAGHLKRSVRRSTESDAPNLAQSLWASFLVLFAGCPNILGIGVPSRGQLLREARRVVRARAVRNKLAAS